MTINPRNPGKLARMFTIATLCFIVCWGAAMVIWPIKPFWVDEWRVIYNLKFKDHQALWGPLDYLQQFPRVYLQLVKSFTEYFDYSYSSLRFPSFVVGTALILFGYRVMNKIYPADNYNRFLLIMILVSCCTFTDYYVQIKQYSMDLLLPLVAIWQLLTLFNLKNKGTVGTFNYFLLCMSMLILPFFSYTYPIALAPVFVLQGMWSVHQLRTRGREGLGATLMEIFPLLLAAISIGVFYKIDVAQLMADQGMKKFWGHLMMTNGFKWSIMFYGLYNLFAEIGAGTLYWYIFGILGLLSFFAGTYHCIKYTRTKNNSLGNITLLYSIMLLYLMIALFLAGKYPLGEPRLNAFSIPAIAILIINFIDRLKNIKRGVKVSYAISIILFAGVTGNIYTTCYANFSGEAFAHKMTVYQATERAITMAEADNLPILTTPEVAWPYDKTLNYPFSTTIPGDWVLKTFPAYHVAKSIPVYPINNMADAKETLNRMNGVNAVLAGDGRNYMAVRR